MSLATVDLGIVNLSYSGGSVEVQTIMSIDVHISDPKTPVKTMRRVRRALGYTRGVPDFTADLKVIYPTASPEIDWDALLASGEEFLIVYEQGLGGQRYQLVSCVVDDITKPFNEGGKTEFTVKITALDHRPEA